MNFRVKIFILTLLLVVVLAFTYLLGGWLFDRAHFRLGEYGVFIEKVCGKDVTGVQGVWYVGYQRVEEAYVYAGVVWGVMLGFCISFALWLTGQISKAKNEKEKL
jgi:hypothetical protein